MKQSVSVVIITKNAESTLRDCLKSITDVADEIVIVDDHSTDHTHDIAQEFQAVFSIHRENDLGKQKSFAISKARGPWILLLDSDERISDFLKEEIKNIMKHPNKITGYKIRFQNHFLRRRVSHGGENYTMLRLFKKDSVSILPALVHEHVRLQQGKLGSLNGTIHHYSYRSLPQMISKFTDYAARDARQKLERGEKTELKHLILYPIHMFWARFIEDRGYKDGLFRIPLDLGFAYMEFMTYLFLLYYSVTQTKERKLLS